MGNKRNLYAKFALIRLGMGEDKATRKNLRTIRKNPQMLEAFLLGGIPEDVMAQGRLQDFIQFLIDNKEALLDLILVIIGMFGASTGEED